MKTLNIFHEKTQPTKEHNTRSNSKPIFSSNLHLCCKIAFNSCSVIIREACTSIARTFQWFMENFNPIKISLLISLFMSPIVAYHAHFFKLHNKTCSYIIFWVSDGKMSYRHKICCFKLLFFISNVGLLSNFVYTSLPLNFNNFILLLLIIVALLL
jgi:hypothetical protein